MTKFVTPFVMAGVAGHLAEIVNRTATTFRVQKWRSEWRKITIHGTRAVIRAEIRFDDECGNGKNSFSITGEAYERNADGSARYADRYMVTAGCCHEDIARAFPELAPFIKWHLTDSSAPMHYIANATYHAGDRDYRGLRLGEQKPLTGPDGVPFWELVIINEDGTTAPAYTLPKAQKGYLPPEATPRLEWRKQMITGEGKPRDLNAARSCAVWPEATDEELSVDRAELEAALKARHPALMAEFRAAMDSLGFQWEPQPETATA